MSLIISEIVLKNVCYGNNETVLYTNMNLHLYKKKENSELNKLVCLLRKIVVLFTN